MNERMKDRYLQGRIYGFRHPFKIKTFFYYEIVPRGRSEASVPPVPDLWFSAPLQNQDIFLLRDRTQRTFRGLGASRAGFVVFGTPSKTRHFFTTRSYAEDVQRPRCLQGRISGFGTPSKTRHVFTTRSYTEDLQRPASLIQLFDELSGYP